jgi:putative peptidoglycan lipid II flippase
MTMISRVLGLLRDVVFARFLGADAAADAFYVAFRIPNLFRRFFAEGAFSQAFVPVLSEYRAGGSRQAVQHLIDRVSGCLGLSLVALCGFAILAAPLITVIFAPGYGWGTEKAELTSALIRIMFPYLLLISLAGFLSSILNAYDRFAIPALTPVFLNIVLILAAAVVSPRLETPVLALAWGVLIAGGVQLAFQWPFVRQLGLAPKPRVDFADPAVKKVLGLMAPALFGASVSQLNIMINTLIASFLPTGSVSWMYYSDRLVELPLGIFAVAIATVILPVMSRQIKLDAQQGNATLDWGLRSVLYIAVPACIALVVLAEPLLIALFAYGATSLNDVHMASFSLMTYSLGLPAFMLIKVLVSGFSSRQDTRTPVRIGLWVMASNLLLNAILVWPMHHWWHLGHAGLTLATAGAAGVNAIWLLWALKHKGWYSPLAGWGRFWLQLLLAAGTMLACLLALTALAPPLGALPGLLRIGWLALFTGAGLLAYGLALWVLGVRVRHLRPQGV